MNDISWVVEEYGEEFDYYEDAYSFLSDKFEWLYGKSEDIAEAYHKDEWVCSRITYKEEE